MIQYKIVIIDNDGNKTWEDGPNRVLCIAKTLRLKELKPCTYLISAIWNHFTISFNIYYPLKDGFDSINIVGAPQPLNNWLRKGEETIQMKLSEKKTITARDGSKVEGCFWSVTVPFLIQVTIHLIIDILFTIQLLRHQYERKTVKR